MKLIINTELKEITVDGYYKFSDIVKTLEKMLPKDSPIGYWKDFNLKQDVAISNSNMITYIPYYINQYPYFEPTWVYTASPSTAGDVSYPTGTAFNSNKDGSFTIAIENEQIVKNAVYYLDVN